MDLSESSDVSLYGPRNTRDSNGQNTTYQMQTGRVLRQRERHPEGPFTGNTQKPYLRQEYVHSRYSGTLYQGNDQTFTVITGCVDGAYSHWSDPFTLDSEVFFSGNAGVISNGPNPLVNPDLLSQAEVKALNGLRGKSSEADVDLSLWYGERHETAQAFKGLATGLVDLARAIANKDFRASANVLRDSFGVAASASSEARRVARLERKLKKALRNTPRNLNHTFKSMEDAALAYNLGWSPLVKDLQDAHHRLQTGDLITKTAVRSVGRYSRQRQDTDVTTFAEVQRKNEYSELHGYTVTLVAVPTDTELAKLSRLGLTNPANTLWQLTRLSFLIDYVYAMGPFLTALDIPSSFRFEQGSWTQRVARVISGEVKSPKGSVARGSSVLNFTKRSLYSSFPVPIPPLSLREREVSFRQSVNTGLVAVKALRKLLA